MQCYDVAKTDEEAQIVFLAKKNSLYFCKDYKSFKRGTAHEGPKKKAVL